MTPHLLRRFVTRAASSPISAVLVLALLAAACGRAPSPAGGGLDREAFIATYVELRSAAVRQGTAELTDAARTEVLTRMGVTEEALLAFAEAHGADVDFMRAIWDEVEGRLEAIRIEGGPGDDPS